MAPVSTGSVEEYVVAFAEGGSAAVLDQPHFEEGEGVQLLYSSSLRISKLHC